MTVLDIEGNFLSELVDYANTTISRDILLNVPDANLELGWFGLKPNAKYITLSIHGPIYPVFVFEIISFRYQVQVPLDNNVSSSYFRR